MSDFAIVSISPEVGTMVINWGTVTLNHFIPSDLAGADSLSAAQIEERIEAMRPTVPEPVRVPAALAAMVQSVAIDPDVRERVWRDRCISPLIESRDRHRDEVELGMLTTLTASQFAELLAHIQKLREWPQSPDFPDSERRPVAPAWINNQTE